MNNIEDNARDLRECAIAYCGKDDGEKVFEFIRHNDEHNHAKTADEYYKKFLLRLDNQPISRKGFEFCCLLALRQRPNKIKNFYLPGVRNLIEQKYSVSIEYEDNGKNYRRAFV